MDSSSSATPQRLDLAVLSNLRAEDEPWLSACYVEPAEFAAMVGARNALILGETGSGKTALRQHLENAWQRRDINDASWLLVRWQFNALAGASESLAGSPLATRQQVQVFDAIARALLTHLVQLPDRWSAAPPWAKATLAWFIRRFLQGDPQIYVESLVAEHLVLEPVATFLREINTTKDRDLLPPDASPVAVMIELASALPRIGLPGVRILMADVEPWWEAYPTKLVESLVALLATLALFEHPAFAYTFLLPDSLWSHLSRTPAVERRRIQVFPLRYQEFELVRIVERRLALALGRSEATLADLGPAQDLRNWLKGCGGVSPRGWLETARPFLAAHLARQDASQPLTAQEYRAIQMSHPPVLWLDPKTDHVVVGWRRVTNLSSGHFAILKYLSDHAGEMCSRKDLYKEYQKASYSEYVEKDIKSSDITGVLDSALWRLRAAIEPTPESPTLLETKRGKGVRLRSPARDWRERTAT